MYNIGKPDAKPRFSIAGSPVAGCGPYGCRMRAVGPAIAGRSFATDKDTKTIRESQVFYQLYFNFYDCFMMDRKGVLPLNKSLDLFVLNAFYTYLAVS